MVKITDSANDRLARPGSMDAATFSCTSDDRIATTNTSIIDQRPMYSTSSNRCWRDPADMSVLRVAEIARYAMHRNLPIGIATLATRMMTAMPIAP